MAEASVIQLPADLQALVDDFSAIEREADAIVDALDDDQFNWSPRPGAWSIGQCFSHLNAMNTLYYGIVAEAVEKARRAGVSRERPIHSSFVGRAFIKSLEPPARIKMRAPRATVPPAERRYKADVWPAFVRFHAHLRSSIASMTDVDLNRATFPNPFLGRLVRMRAGTGLRIMAAHDRRHVWQAAQVHATAGFPR
jgi:hypothetical protein